MIKSYGIHGESQETRTELTLGAPYVLMQSDRPEQHYVATESGEWVEPEDAREYKHFTGQEKIDLFTEQEQRDIYSAAYVSGDIDVLMFCKRLDIADYLAYSDPRVEMGLSLLVAKDLLTAERKAEIVSTMSVVTP